ncbi:coproporphyrinogen dehydrogenase HemZ [Syntrophomonas palmitatica]|uniref:coproporphyrinogen dehydrogenase HemZ n=1 Tax=Syntrophomonas palmitatica TaxID=402877 RepID=UPI0006CF67E2|nr:coproporphyrinogen dehydrogenase HemZ [Syntrophomonas palmitatica]
MLKVYLQPEWLYDSVHELIRMAFPGHELSRDNEGIADITINIELQIREKALRITGQVLSPDKNTFQNKSLLLHEAMPDGLNEAKKAVRIFTYEMLEEHLAKDINAYGILTGMRPVKLVQRMLDQGYSREVLLNILQQEYRLNEDKARLLAEVAGNNRSYLLSPEQAAKTISIYIGIPFCPSRCTYCTFPGAVLKNHEGELDSFLSCLQREMLALGECIKELGLQVQSIYIGGGTPTVLSQAATERLFELLAKRFISQAVREITVEAGRPDTLTLPKLKFLKESGVNRVCVNPQTMNDATLQKIGRKHDREGVIRSVEWVREAGIPELNMDLIVGLPGEGIRENAYTAENILALKPENVTVHTLALKRGSALAEMRKDLTVEERVKEVRMGVELFADALRTAGYDPYYLYRQKYMQASMENTGYSLPGHYCLYNVQMIEERQTIIGLGGGGASKFVHPGDWNLTSFYNPRDPISYCNSIETLIKRKVDKLRALN